MTEHDTESSGRREPIYVRNGDLEKDIPRLISKFSPVLDAASEYNIAVVLVTGKTPKRGGRLTLGQVRVVKDPVKMFTSVSDGNSDPVDFIIEIFEDNIAERGLTEDNLKNFRRLVLVHELQHVGEMCKVRPHDVEDFSWMLTKFGLNWTSEEQVPDPLA